MKINFKILMLGLLCVSASCFFLVQNCTKKQNTPTATVMPDSIIVANTASTNLHEVLEKNRIIARKNADSIVSPIEIITAINSYLSAPNNDSVQVVTIKPDSVFVVAEFIDNAKSINDSVIELSFAREKIKLLKADSARFFKLNIKLIVDLKQARETIDFYENRWHTVEQNYRVSERNGIIKIVPKGRLKRAFFDLCKIGAGYLIGKNL